MNRIIFLLFFFHASLFGKGNVDSLLLKAVELSYDVDFKNAEKILNEYLSLYPDKPDAFYFLAKNYLIKFLAKNSDEDKIIFEKFSSLALEKAKKFEENQGETAWNDYILGSTYLLQAVLKSREGKLTASFLKTEKSVSYLEDAIERMPGFYEPYTGLGILNYALSRVPSGLKIFLSIAGLGHDAEKAIGYLRSAFDFSVYEKPEAAYQLSRIYREYLFLPDSADFFADFLVKKFSHNPLYLYQKALVLFDKKDFDGAWEFLDAVTSANNRDFLQTVAYGFFVKGEIAFLNNDFEKAIVQYRSFLNKTCLTEYLGYANFKLALAERMLGHRKEFRKELELTALGDENIAKDKFASQLADYYKAHGFSFADSIFILAWNGFQKGDYQNCMRSLSKLRKQNNIYAGEFLSLKGLCYFEKGEYKKAINMLRKAIDEGLEFRKDFLALDYLYLAKAFWKFERVEEARKYLEIGKQNDVYQFIPQVSPQINLLLRKINTSSP